MMSGYHQYKHIYIYNMSAAHVTPAPTNAVWLHRWLLQEPGAHIQSFINVL
jgi:hypothetical protein